MKLYVKKVIFIAIGTLMLAGCHHCWDNHHKDCSKNPACVNKADCIKECESNPDCAKKADCKKKCESNPDCAKKCGDK